MSFAANRAWPIDVRVELQQKQHAVIGDVLDALAHLEDLAENKLERSRLVACRIDDDDPALIEAILDDGDALDQALRRGAPGVRLVVYEVADVDDAFDIAFRGAWRIAQGGDGNRSSLCERVPVREARVRALIAA